MSGKGHISAHINEGKEHHEEAVCAIGVGEHSGWSGGHRSGVPGICTGSAAATRVTGSRQDQERGGGAAAERATTAGAGDPGSAGSLEARLFLWSALVSDAAGAVSPAT